MTRTKSENMKKAHELIPVSKYDEALAISNKKVCKCSKEDLAKVQDQTEKVYGVRNIIISPRGVVFAWDEMSYLGRIDADFNFYEA